VWHTLSGKRKEKRWCFLALISDLYSIHFQSHNHYTYSLFHEKTATIFSAMYLFLSLFFQFVKTGSFQLQLWAKLNCLQAHKLLKHIPLLAPGYGNIVSIVQNQVLMMEAFQGADEV